MEITTDVSIDQSSSRTSAMAWRWALRLYVGYSTLFILWNAWVSSVYPKWVEEASVASWPPSTPPGVWLERVVLLPLLRYDVIWYIGIAQHGYGHRSGDTAFHPLYPFLTGVLGRVLGGEYLLAAWLIAQVCCVAMLAMLYRLVTLDDDDATAQRTTLFLIGSPLGFSFLLPYTESLLLLSIVAAWYAGRQGRWWLAGMAGGAAALTKQPGVIVLLPLLWELWQQHAKERTTGIRSLVRPLVGLSLTPLALLAWIVYRATLGDVAFSWRHPETLISALLVTPAYADVWGETFSWPWVNFGYALEQLRERPYFYLIINVMIMLMMLALTLAAAIRTRHSYALYSLILATMNLSIVYPLWPYMGIIRRFTIIFPMFIQLARWGRSPVVCWLVLVCNALLWSLIASMYVRNAFVP